MNFKIARFMVLRRVFNLLTGHDLLVNVAKRARHKGESGKEYATVITPITGHMIIREVD